jgi:hypothetical protein
MAVSTCELTNVFRVLAGVDSAVLPVLLASVDRLCCNEATTALNTGADSILLEVGIWADSGKTGSEVVVIDAGAGVAVVGAVVEGGGELVLESEAGLGGVPASISA